MRKVIISMLAWLAIAGLSFAATVQPKASPTHRKRTASKATGSKSVAKATTTKTSTVKSKSSKTKGKTVRRPVRSYQQAPTPERYQEIQQALASKGYFQGEANGRWGTDSNDALKRFQAEQNLTPDGKLNSLSLIALGLGPKRLTAQSKSANPAPTSNPAPPSAPAAQ